MVNGRFAGLSVDPYGLRSYLPSRMVVVWSTIAAYVRITRRQREREEEEEERERERKARRGG